jgi:FAD/FMN-containing dehydrogenase
MDLQDSLSRGGPHNETPFEDIASVLRGIVGHDAVLTDLAERTFFSTDIAGRGAVAAAVVRIDDAATLQSVVRACTERNTIVVPRGGGFSYTGGYTPTSENSVIVDMRGLNRIVEINTVDMYVVVEVGCTWNELYEALKAKGVRTPYFGPMSGYRATVGGALSQGSFFLGSSQHGPVSESVLGLEVVLADGTLLRTGAGASPEGTPPFFRQYGPDATGLFLSDTGAMGLKTRAVLRLIKFPRHQAYGSFTFTDFHRALEAISEIGRCGLAAECYCWDPYFVRLMAAAASTGTSEDLRFLLNVVKAGAGLLDGLGAAARIALAGRSVFKGDTWLMHVVIDDASAAGAAEKLKLARAIAAKAAGKEASPSAPRALRGTPFTDFNTAERRTPKRNLPIHGLAPHSRAAAVTEEIYGVIADHAAEMERDDIGCGVILFAVGGQTVAIEPLIHWADEQHFQHNRVEETTDLVELTKHVRPRATETAFELRKAFKAVFRRHGCIHLQIGRSYPWRETRDPATLKLITAVKHAVDPDCLINRGSLGFEP